MKDADYHEDSNIGKFKLYSDSPKFEISVSYMKYFWRFILMGAIIAKLTHLYFSVPEKGMRVFEVFGMSGLNPNSPMFWKKILVFKLSPDFFHYPLLFLILACVLTVVYWIVLCKYTNLSINFKFIEYRHGIFVRQVDTIDLIRVKDQRCSFSWHDRMLGLSNLDIESSDKTLPHLALKGLKYADGFNMMNYIRENNYQSYTDYRIDKDKSLRKSNKRNDDDGDDEIVGSGNSDGDQ